MLEKDISNMETPTLFLLFFHRIHAHANSIVTSQVTVIIFHNNVIAKENLYFQLLKCNCLVQEV